jgi:hypothetical protein
MDFVRLTKREPILLLILLSVVTIGYIANYQGESSLIFENVIFLLHWYALAKDCCSDVAILFRI